MEDLSKDQLDLLLFIHQSQREESLGHRRSMLSAFSLSMTGLMAILAGALAVGHMSQGTKWGVGVAVVVVLLSIGVFMWQQRKKAEEGMEILRPVEERLGLYESGRYLPDRSVLPESFRTSRGAPVPFTLGDWIELASLSLLALVVILVVCGLPSI